MKARLLVTAVVIAGFALTASGVVVADEPECDFDSPELREGFSESILGVEVSQERVCAPDDPRSVGVTVLGANHAPDSLMVETSVSERAVSKSTGLAGVEDYSVVDSEIEIVGIARDEDGWTEGDERWVFAPKTRGVEVDDSVVRPQSPTLRAVEDGLLFLWAENSNRMSHTVNFDGVNIGTQRTAFSADSTTVHPGDSGMYTIRRNDAGVYTYYSDKNRLDAAMGLSGLVVIEESDPERIQTHNFGAGKVRAPSYGTEAVYDAEYDLVYGGVKDGFVRAAQRYEDPEQVEEAADEYADKPYDSVVLNGYTYPDTLRESLIVAEEGGTYRLNVGNTASESLTVSTEAGDLSVYDYETGTYETVDTVELAPKQAERVRLEVDELDGTEPLYVKERDIHSDDAPTTFVATEDALDEDYMPHDVPVNSGSMPAVSVLAATLAGFLVGSAALFGVAVVRRRNRRGGDQE